MSYYPVFLNIKDKRCMVVGGGAVALRKVNMLLDHGAQVEVISPALCPGLTRLAEDGVLHATKREYRPGDLEGAFLVIAATDRQETNDQIAREANERGILINVADVPRLCNFIIPSYFRRGNMTIAISTNAKSPALARRIRAGLEDQFGEEYGTLASLVEEVRSELKERRVRVSPEGWQRALDLDALLGSLRQGKRDEARKKLMDALGEATDQ